MPLIYYIVLFIFSPPLWVLGYSSFSPSSCSYSSPFYPSSYFPSPAPIPYKIYLILSFSQFFTLLSPNTSSSTSPLYFLILSYPLPSTPFNINLLSSLLSLIHNPNHYSPLPQIYSLHLLASPRVAHLQPTKSRASCKEGTNTINQRQCSGGPCVTRHYHTAGHEALIVSRKNGGTKTCPGIY